MATEVKMLIGGAWVGARSGNTLDVRSPANQETVGRVPRADGADVAAALATLNDGFEQWQHTDPWERSRILRIIGQQLVTQKDRFVRLITEDVGKPEAEAVGEVVTAAEQFDWCADETRRIFGRVVQGRDENTISYVYQRPIGPVALFPTWNFPLLLSARKLATALGAGCSAMLVPPFEAPRASLLLGELMLDAGVPAKALSILTGMPAELSADIIDSPVIRKISLTGSPATARILLAQAAKSLKPVTTELGGHAPVLVFADADLEQAAQQAVKVKYRNAGQVCTSPTRFYVHESQINAFTDRVNTLTRALTVGDGRYAATQVGPIIHERRLKQINELVAGAVSAGATLVAGGHRIEREGHFYAPTILRDIPDHADIMTDEPFGPVMLIQPFSTLDEVVEMANRSAFGLAAYVYSDDISLIHEVVRRLDVGFVGVNKLLAARAELPLGGVKDSGHGREGGGEGVAEFLVTKYADIQIATGSPPH